MKKGQKTIVRTFRLSNEHEEWISEQVATDRFASPSHCVRWCIRQQMDREGGNGAGRAPRVRDDMA
jgi:Arc/MetJ-type ribon-helix-helix transcriptional regulator